MTPAAPAALATVVNPQIKMALKVGLAIVLGLAGWWFFGRKKSNPSKRSFRARRARKGRA
jgi:hypothetical protein